MLYGFVPKWLDKIERRLGWLAIPNLGLLLISLQGLGFLLVLFDRKCWDMLVLDPRLVIQGELWRLVGFLALPVSTSPVWMVFALYFFYFIINGVESEWGAFKTTFYVLVSVVLTIAFSFAFDVRITSVSHLGTTLFFAAAAIAPEYEILLFFILPVKLKWLAWISFVFIVLQLVAGPWLLRLYPLMIYANFLLFFGPYYRWQFKQWQRRRGFKQQYRNSDEE